MTKKPNSLRHLDDAIRRACGGSSVRKSFPHESFSSLPPR